MWKKYTHREWKMREGSKVEGETLRTLFPLEGCQETGSHVLDEKQVKADVSRLQPT